MRSRHVCSCRPELLPPISPMCTRSSATRREANWRPTPRNGGSPDARCRRRRPDIRAWSARCASNTHCGSVSREEENGMTSATSERVRRDILDGTEEDLRRLPTIDDGDPRVQRRDDLFGRIDAIAPVLAADVALGEELRRLPDTTVSALRDAALLRLKVP